MARHVKSLRGSPLDEIGAIWVGMLDLDREEGMIETVGSLQPRHSEARILIRIHGAPIGYVQVSTTPRDTLADRARTVALESLADAIASHDRWDNRAKQADEWRSEAPWASCPHAFPAPDGTGITVAVCTRDRTSELVTHCIPALQRSTYEPFEILIVDNSSSGDATKSAVAAITRQDSRVRYIREPVGGLSMARNRALASAKFDLVAFTDDDAIPDVGWVAAVAAAFMLDPRAACVTGPLIPAALDTEYQRYFQARYSWGEEFEPRRYNLDTHRHSSRLYPFSAGIFGAGANFAVNRRVAIEVDGFDPLLGAGSLGRGGEDLDMFLRLILAGCIIDFVPSAIVFHRHRIDMQALMEQTYSYGHGLGAYLSKHMGNDEFRAALRSCAFQQSKAALGRIREASQLSHLRGAGGKLALAEVRGLLAGAVRYHRAVRGRRPRP